MQGICTYNRRRGMLVRIQLLATLYLRGYKMKLDGEDILATIAFLALVSIPIMFAIMLCIVLFV